MLGQHQAEHAPKQLGEILTKQIFRELIQQRTTFLTYTYRRTNRGRLVDA